MRILRAYKSREIRIGNLRMGGNNPVLLQSMTNTPTLDTTATADQCRRIIEAGADMVRITARNEKEAFQLSSIKNDLLASGYDVPLIADIHFNPKVAEIAAKIVEKVRINPGNYVDRNISGSDITDREYKDELKIIQGKLYPLIEICKAYKTAIRIGTNHGSLSNRILQKYGNTVKGMAESAMEFVRICHDLEFNDLVLSMKSSDVRVMVYSTRLLVKMMQEEGFDFPLHLGVTEAGSEQDGRIRSAAGTGSLLALGIGDTIRVSLTEPPENEIPVARQIVKPFKMIREAEPQKVILNTDFNKADKVILLNGDTVKHLVVGNSFNKKRQMDADLIYKEGKLLDRHMKAFNNKLHFIRSEEESCLQKIREMAFSEVTQDKNPGIVTFESSSFDNEIMMLAVSFTSLALIDGYADGIFINTNEKDDKCIEVAFSLLQFLKLRLTKTEYISCPTCGRTQFDILGVLKKVKEETSHLKGLKIAVMGCIVNGPGEMADADYGYVGSGPDKVNLYKGNKLVKSNVRQDDALEELIRLIKESGDWE